MKSEQRASVSASPRDRNFPPLRTRGKTAEHTLPLCSCCRSGRNRDEAKLRRDRKTDVGKWCVSGVKGSKVTVWRAQRLNRQIWFEMFIQCFSYKVTFYNTSVNQSIGVELVTLYKKLQLMHLAKDSLQYLLVHVDFNNALVNFGVNAEAFIVGSC